MKKNILGLAVFVAAFVFAMPSQAQVKFGVKAGLNLNSVSIKDVKSTLDANNRAGFFAGATADVTIPLLGFGADASLLYDNKRLSLSNEDGTDSKTLHYISLPINVKYTLGFSSLVSAYVATGPQFSWNVGSKNWSPAHIKQGWELKKSEFSWNIGLGATFIDHVRIGYNYNIGIGDTAKATLLGTATQAVTGKLKNNTHQISVAYIF